METCNKKSYDNKRDAMTEARNINTMIPKEEDRRLNAYKCRKCKAWHLSKHYKREYKKNILNIKTGTSYMFAQIKHELRNNYDIELTQKQLKAYLYQYNSYKYKITELLSIVNRDMQPFKDFIINN